MKRTATEILRDLETRVASLESRGASNFRNPYLDATRRREPSVPSWLGDTPFNSSGNPGTGKDSFLVPEKKPTKVLMEEGDFVIILGESSHQKVRNVVEDFLKRNPEVYVERDVRHPLYRSGNISFADYILSVSEDELGLLKPLTKRLSKIENVYFDIPSNYMRHLGLRVASLERQADTSLSHEVHRKIKEELNKYTGMNFGSLASISVIQREASKRSDSDFVWVKVEEGEKFAYVIFELLPIGLVMNFMFYDLVDYKMAKKDFSKYVRRGRI